VTDFPFSPKFVPGRRHFFAAFGTLSVVLAVTGFSQSFFVPLARRALVVPPIVYIHGALFLGWVTLLLVQTLLVGRRRIRSHRRVGWIAVALVPAMAASGIGVGLWATARDVRAGEASAALPFLLGLVTDMMTFAVLASSAIATRRRPETHKRLMVMATIVVLGAALVRLIALVSASVRPWNIALTTCLVLSVAAFDLHARRRVHSATVWGGAAVLANLIAQRPLGHTDLWLRAAHGLLGVTNP
jgi:hypothetical protein